MRDWIYVEDNVRALLVILKKGSSGEAFNVGAGRHVRNIDLARKILEQCGAPGESIEFVEDRKGHDFRYAVDTTKINDLGWHPQIDLDTGLKLTIEWFRIRQSTG